MLGDSFAGDFINMGLETRQLDRHAISRSPLRSCLPAGLPADIRETAARADFIVIARRLTMDEVQCLPRLIATLRAASPARVIVIGRKSFGYNNNAIKLLPAAQRYDWRVRPLADAAAVDAAARRVLPPDIYVDTLAMLGDAEGRVRVFTPGRMFISQDNEHLTRAGAAYVGAILFRHPALAALHAGRPPS